MQKMQTKLFTAAGILALASLACRSIPGFAPTLTPTPLPTATPRPTATPTEAPSPPPIPLGSSFTEELPNGTIRFVDVEHSYQITLIEHWFPVDASTEFDEIAELYPELDQLFQEFMQGDDRDQFRLISYDFDPVFINPDFITNLNVIVFEDAAIEGISMESFVEFNADFIPQMFPDAEILSTDTILNPNGVELGVIQARFGQTTSEGLQEDLLQKQFYAKVDVGIAIFTFSAQPGNFLDLEPDFDQIMDSFEYLDVSAEADSP